MLTKEQAKEKVELKINGPDRYLPKNLKLVVMDEFTIEKEWGWVFFYQSEEYLKTGNFSSQLAGNAPILVNKLSAELIETGTAYPVEDYIKEYEQKLKKSV